MKNNFTTGEFDAKEKALVGPTTKGFNNIKSNLTNQIFNNLNYANFQPKTQYQKFCKCGAVIEHDDFIFNKVRSCSKCSASVQQKIEVQPKQFTGRIFRLNSCEKCGKIFTTDAHSTAKCRVAETKIKFQTIFSNFLKGSLTA